MENWLQLCWKSCTDRAQLSVLSSLCHPAVGDMHDVSPVAAKVITIQCDTTKRWEHVLLCGGSTAIHTAKRPRSAGMMEADGRGWQAVWIEIKNLLSLVLVFFKVKNIIMQTAHNVQINVFVCFPLPVSG